MQITYNPDTSTVEITLVAEQSQDAKYTLYDNKGNLVETKKAELKQGKNKLSIPVNQKPGTYVVRVYVDDVSKIQLITIE